MIRKPSPSKLLKKATHRLLTRAAQKRHFGCADSYRATTVRDWSANGLFQQPARRGPGLRGAVALAVLLAAIFPAIAGAEKPYRPNRKAQTQFDQGMEAQSAGDHTRAIGFLTAAINLDGRWADPWRERAVSHLAAGKMSDAADDIVQALQRNAEDDKAQAIRGDVLARAGHYKEAIEAYTRAMQLGRRMSAVYNGRGASYLALEMWKEAIADFDRGIPLKLDVPEAHFQRGKAKAQLSRWEDAIEDFTSAIQRRPDYWDAYAERAHSHGSNGRFDLGMGDLNRVIATNPAHVRALGLRAEAHQLQGNYEDSIRDYNEAIRNAPGDVRLLLGRGSAYARMGQHGKALEDRSQAIALNPSMAEAYVARGGSYHFLGEHEKGLADRAEAIRLNPKLAVAWVARGNAYFLLERWEDAANDLRQALELDNSDPTVRDLLGKAEAKIRDKTVVAESKPVAPDPPPAARQASEAVAKQSPPQEPPAPKPPPVVEAAAPTAEAEAAGPTSEAGPLANPTAESHHQAARDFIAQGKFKDALMALNQVLALEPDHFMARNARGYAYLRLRQPLPAIEDFTRAIRLYPNYANAYHNRSIARKMVGDAAGADEDARTAAKLLGTPGSAPGERR